MTPFFPEILAFLQGTSVTETVQLRQLKMKLTGKIKTGILNSGLFNLVRKIKPNYNVTILRYHAVVNDVDNFYASSGISISVHDFERHVKYFAEHYHIVSLDAVIDTILAGEPLSPNLVVFTFDDGYADNFQAAAILKKYGGTGTFYLTTDCIDRKESLWLFETNYLIQESQVTALNLKLKNGSYDLPLRNMQQKHAAQRRVIELIKSNNREVRESVRTQIRQQLAKNDWQETADRVMLTWPQVQKMAADGMTIGGHTLSHLNLPNAEPDDARREISGCKKVLEEKLNMPIRHFSVPNSGPYAYYNKAVKKMVQEYGFVSSVTSANGFVNQASDLFELRRIRTVPELHEVVAAIEFDKLFS